MKASAEATRPRGRAAGPGDGALPAKWAWHYRTLCRLRNELMEHRFLLVHDSRETPNQAVRDKADASTEEFDRDLLLAELSHNQDALYEVDAALQRIEAGTYGICEQSGKPIPAARLKALPSTRFTCEAEQTLEEKGLIRRIRLGELHSVRQLETA